MARTSAKMVKREQTVLLPPEPYCETVETYMPPGWLLSDIKNHHKQPSSGNGLIRVRKYRVTFELIDEPIEVIQARIMQLWRDCKNHHEWDALRREAKRYGLELTHEMREKTW